MSVPTADVSAAACRAANPIPAPVAPALVVRQQESPEGLAPLPPEWPGTPAHPLVGTTMVQQHYLIC